MAAAFELGLDQFSMQSIAEHLGVTPPALYTHVRGRPEVLELVAASMAAKMDLDTIALEAWDQWLTDYARQIRSNLAGAAPSLRVDLGGALARHQLQMAEGGVQLLMDAGFSAADAGRVLWLVCRLCMTAGNVGHASLRGPLAEVREIQGREADLGRDQLPATSLAIDELAREAELDTFEFDLAVVILGLRQILASGQS